MPDKSEVSKLAQDYARGFITTDDAWDTAFIVIDSELARLKNRPMLTGKAIANDPIYLALLALDNVIDGLRSL